MTSKADVLISRRQQSHNCRVKLGDHSGVTLADDAVAIAGFYDFSRPAADGHPVVVPGRFSFVMVKKDGIWKIAYLRGKAAV
jgi:Domain of unknown function (DUF4440)